MKIYSRPYHLSRAMRGKKIQKKNASAASLDTHGKQCLQNPLIRPTIQYVYIPSAKWQSILSLSLLIFFFRPLLLIVTSHQRRKLQLLHFSNCWDNSTTVGLWTPLSWRFRQDGLRSGEALKLEDLRALKHLLNDSFRSRRQSTGGYRHFHINEPTEGQTQWVVPGVDA